jgi:ABC-type transport system involved in cytochrome bd biosynthesis fused ATPase/permease subunit
VADVRYAAVGNHYQTAETQLATAEQQDRKMHNHLVERGNLRDAAIGLIVGLAIAAILAMVSIAHAQSGATMGLIEQGVSMAQSLAIQQQSMSMQRQAMQQQRAAQQAAQTPPYAPCPTGYRHQIVIHADGQKTLGSCELVKR